MAVGNNVSGDVQDAVKDAIGKTVSISTFCSVNHETRLDKYETRILALSSYRFYILVSRGTQVRLESSVSFFDIEQIESRIAHKLVLGTCSKKYVFFVQEDHAEYIDSIVYPIVEFYAKVFPKVPFQRMVPRFDMKHDKSPRRKEELLQRVCALREKDVGPCDGFSASYRAACDYHALLYMDEVTWDIDTIYLAHAMKELTLSDFDHLDPKYLLPIVTALQHNTWFTALNASNVKLNADVMTEINKVMKTNTSIEELVLSNTGLKSDNIQVLCLSLLANDGCPLTRLDLSHNNIEDRGLNHLCGPLTKLSRGLIHLNLSHTGLSARGVNRLAETFSSSKLIPATLHTLDLSGNNMRGDELMRITEGKTLLQFLAMPNNIKTLRLSGMDCLLESMFAALLRGCALNLEHLDLSKNYYNSRKSSTKEPVVPMAWKEFFSSVNALHTLCLSEIKLPAEALKYVLLGVASNPSIQSLSLDLSGCALGQSGAQVLETCLPGITNITSLDISNNGLEQHLASLLGKISQNRSIRHLAIGKNLTNTKARYVTSAMDAAVGMIHQDDSCLESLSLADSKLKGETVVLINALGSNITLTDLDISGNLMGDAGARMLAKALLINTRLRVVHWDKNNISPQGLHDIALALEKNYTVRVMPAPVHDATQALRVNQAKTEEALKTIERMLQRNHSPHKFGGEQAYRLQQSFINSSTQQLLDKPAVRLQTAADKLRSNHQVVDAVGADLEAATKVLHDVNNSRQLLMRLQTACESVESTDSAIYLKLQSISDDLHVALTDTLKKTVKNMVDCAETQCPTVLQSESSKKELEEESLEKCILPSSFTHTLLMEHVATDVSNKVSALNLAAASEMSDRVVESSIDAMEKSTKRLEGHLTTLENGGSVDDVQASLRMSLVRNSTLNPAPANKADGLKLQVKQTRMNSRMRPLTIAAQAADNVDKSLESLVDSMDWSTTDSQPHSREGTPVCSTPDSPKAPDINKTIYDKRKEESVKTTTLRSESDDSKVTKRTEEHTSVEPEEKMSPTSEKAKDVTKEETEDGEEKTKATKSKKAEKDKTKTTKAKKDDTDGTKMQVKQNEKEKNKIDQVKEKSASKSTKSGMELPSLQTEARPLEHLGKNRPRRLKTKAALRPMGHLNRGSQDMDAVDETKEEAVDDFFVAAAVSKEVVISDAKPKESPREEVAKPTVNSDVKTKEAIKPAETSKQSETKGKGIAGLSKGFKSIFNKSPKHESVKAPGKSTADKTPGKHTPEKTPIKPTPEKTPIKPTPEKTTVKPEKPENPPERPAERPGERPAERPAEEPEKEVPKPKTALLPPRGGLGMGGGALMAELKQKRESVFPQKSPTGNKNITDEKPTRPPPPKQTLKPTPERNSSPVGDKPLMRNSSGPRVAPKPRNSSGPKPPVGQKPSTPAMAPKPESPPSTRRSIDSTDNSSKTKPLSVSSKPSTAQEDDSSSDSQISSETSQVSKIAHRFSSDNDSKTANGKTPSPTPKDDGLSDEEVDI